MALNWNIENCNDWEQLITDDNWQVTNALIWLTMGVDLGEINESNVNDFYARIKVWERVCGHLLNGSSMENPVSAPYYITFEDVFRRVGLSANVSDKSLNEWLKRVIKIANDKETNLTLTNIKATYYAALEEAEVELKELVGA
jgi:hypothetical protein